MRAGNTLIHRILRTLGFFCVFCFLAGSVPGPIAWAADQTKITILVVNPSDTENLKSPVVYNLPPEVKPENVTDNAGMEIKFDKEKNVYVLSKEFELAPKETKKISVIVQNVWRVTEDDLSQARQQLNQKVEVLKGTKYEKSAALLVERVGQRLDEIEKSQKDVIAKGIGMRRQIDLYRANMKLLGQIKQDVLSLDSLRRLEEESKGALRTIRFQITAENPSDEAKEMTVQSLLAPEITADDVLNKLDFDLTYNQTNQCFMIEKIDSFAAKESKKYTITIRNIWYIPQKELTHLKTQTDKLVELFKDSAFQNYAVQSGQFITDTLNEITALQAEVADSNEIQDHRRAYTLNSQRLVLAKKKVKELQDLVLEIEPNKNPLMEQLEQWLSKLAILRDLLLRKMEYKPNKVTTWVIIFGIIIFLAGLSVAFYMIWIKQIQKDKKMNKTDE